MIVVTQALWRFHFIHIQKLAMFFSTWPLWDECSQYFTRGRMHCVQWRSWGTRMHCDDSCTIPRTQCSASPSLLSSSSIFIPSLSSFQEPSNAEQFWYKLRNGRKCTHGNSNFMAGGTSATWLYFLLCYTIHWHLLAERISSTILTVLFEVDKKSPFYVIQTQITRIFQSHVKMSLAMRIIIPSLGNIREFVCDMLSQKAIGSNLCMKTHTKSRKLP